MIEPNAEPASILTEHFTRESDGSARLRAVVCTRCASRWFPARTVCAHCAGAELDEILVGPHGLVYASTVARVGAAGFTAPYCLAYLDVDELRVLAHVAWDEGSEPVALPPETRVRLEPGTIGISPGIAAYRAVPVNHESKSGEHRG